MIRTKVKEIRPNSLENGLSLRSFETLEGRDPDEGVNIYSA